MERKQPPAIWCVVTDIDGSVLSFHESAEDAIAIAEDRVYPVSVVKYVPDGAAWRNC